MPNPARGWKEHHLDINGHGDTGGSQRTDQNVPVLGTLHNVHGYVHGRVEGPARATTIPPAPHPPRL